MRKLNKDSKKAFVEAASKEYGATLTRAQALEISKANGMKRPIWLLNDAQYRVGRGVYQLPGSKRCSDY